VRRLLPGGLGWQGGGLPLPARGAYLAVAGEDRAPKALRWALDAAVPIAVTTAGIAVLVWLVGVYLETRVLRSRVSFDQVPSRSLAPSAAAVLAQVQGWVRARPLVVLAPRRAYPVRVSLVTDADGMLRHRLTAAARAASVIRSSALPQVELRAASADPEAPPMLSAPRPTASDDSLAARNAGPPDTGGPPDVGGGG
jgi:hypothetical protein